ncbi:TPA: hypothetical protein DIT45_02245 [Candidatus Acetothermia bacterium]|nr:hypothetical protein [Candidatus Acetothermia bacterium]
MERGPAESPADKTRTERAVSSTPLKRIDTLTIASLLARFEPINIVASPDRLCEELFLHLCQHSTKSLLDQGALRHMGNFWILPIFGSS